MILIILLIAILSYYLCKYLVKIFPKSVIPYEENLDECSIEINSNRNFDIMSNDYLLEIDEYIKQKINDLSFVYLFKGYKSKLHKLNDGDIIPMNNLVYIPNNNISWSDNTYFEDFNRVYFPKSNSSILSNHDLMFHSDPRKSLFVFIGTKNK